MKTSNLILISIITALLLGSISYAFYIKANTSERPSPLPSSFLEGKGPYFVDTVATEFSVIRSNFPVIYLDPRFEDTLIVDGYENAREYIDYYVHGDTLEVLNANTDSYERISDGKINSEYTLKVTVGAKNLKGLWLFGEGRVTHDAKPTGARSDGTAVYNPTVLARYKLQLEDLHLTIRDNARFNLFLTVNRINLDYNYMGKSINSISYNPLAPYSFALNSSLNFTGEAQCLSLINPKGGFGINAQTLTMDSLIVLEDGTHNSGGTIYANPSKYLKTKLHSRLNITYDGITESKDIVELGPGRTINTNRAFHIGKNNESQRQTEALVKIAQEMSAQAKDGSLRKLSFMELISLMLNNNGTTGILPGNPIRKNLEGKVLTKIEIQQAIIDSLGADYYADADRVIKEIIFRPRNENDDRLRKEAENIRKKAFRIKNTFINCNNVSQELATLKDSPITNTDTDLLYVVNVIRKCGMPTKTEVGDGINTLYNTLQKASLQYRNEYIPLVEEAVSTGDLQDAQLQQFKKGIEVDESIMKAYYEYPRRADQDNDQKIYEKILKIVEATDRASLGLESLDRLLDRIGIKYKKVVL